MEMIPWLLLALVALFLCGVLRQYNPNHALLLSVAVCAALIVAAAGWVKPVFELTEKLAAYSEWSDLGSVYKVIGIALLAQCTQDLCREAGQTALAGRVEFAGKAAMLVAALPLFSALADILLELLR